MMRIFLSIILIVNIFLPVEALSQSRRILHDAGPAGRLVAGPQGRDGEALRLQREGRAVWQARARRFEAFREGAPIAIAADAAAIGVTGGSGGAYCCWTLHLFHTGAEGLAHIASLPLASGSRISSA